MRFSQKQRAVSLPEVRLTLACDFVAGLVVVEKVKSRARMRGLSAVKSFFLSNLPFKFHLFGIF